MNTLNIINVLKIIILNHIMQPKTADIETVIGESPFLTTKGNFFLEADAKSYYIALYIIVSYIL